MEVIDEQLIDGQGIDKTAVAPVLVKLRVAWPKPTPTRIAILRNRIACDATCEAIAFLDEHRARTLRDHGLLLTEAPITIQAQCINWTP